MNKGRVILFWIVVFVLIFSMCLLPAFAIQDETDAGTKATNQKIKIPFDYESLKEQGYISESGELRIIIELDVEREAVEEEIFEEVPPPESPKKTEKNQPVSVKKKIQEQKSENTQIKNPKVKRQIKYVDETEFLDAREDVIQNVRKLKQRKELLNQNQKTSVKSQASVKTQSVEGKQSVKEKKVSETPSSNNNNDNAISYMALLKKLLRQYLPEEEIKPFLEELSSKSEKKSLEQKENEYVKDLRIIGSIAIKTDFNSLKALAKLDSVKNIYLDKKVHILLSESVLQINATVVWTMQDDNGTNITGEGTKIAIIDTGVDYTHADLGGCTQAQFLNGTCTKVIGGYDFVNNDADPMDDHGHGTHCAATAGGNNTLNGVAPNAQILAYKVMSSGGSGYDSDIIAGVERAVTDGADVISMSLGSSNCDPFDSLAQAINAAVAQGVVNVIAAGNDGNTYGTVGSPGCTPSAITVAAACKTSQVGSNVYCDTNISSFSSRGPAKIYQKPDIAAPGVLICAAQYGNFQSDSECLDDDHIAISGTSMATPHVAGAVALIKQKHPDWDPYEIKAAIKYTADDLGENRLTQGFGLINVGKVIVLETPPPVAHIENVSNIVYD